jgi:PRC-barrel domain
MMDRLERAPPRLVFAFMAVLGLAPAEAQDPSPAPSPFRLPGGHGPVAPPPGTLREGSGPRMPGALYIPEQPGNTLLVTEYLGQAVYGPGKQKVGTISNLLVDTTGRATGVVLDVGGFLGIGTKEVAISFEALFPVREDDQDAFLVEMTRAQLEAAPTFKRSR